MNLKVYIDEVPCSWSENGLSLADDWEIDGKSIENEVLYFDNNGSWELWDIDSPKDADGMWSSRDWGEEGGLAAAFEALLREYEGRVHLEVAR